MKETFLRYSVSKSMKQRVELNRFCAISNYKYCERQVFITVLCIQNKYGPPKKRLFTNVLVMIFSGIQTTVPTKSQGTQCTLLKEMFVTSTPCASDDEPSDSEEEMDADDDLLYVPNPDDERDEDEDFANFDYCLYENDLMIYILSKRHVHKSLNKTYNVPLAKHWNER